MNSSATSVLAFLPTLACDPSPGCYVQLRRGLDFPVDQSRDDCVLYFRARLWMASARILAGGDSISAIARMVERPGVDLDSVRLRWRRFEYQIRSHSLRQRQNSIINSCNHDLFGRSQFVDFLLNDSALVWRLAEIESSRFSEIEDFESELTEKHKEIIFLHKEAYEGRDVTDRVFQYAEEMEYQLVDSLMYCLCRAQSLGRVREYSFTYDLILKVVLFLRKRESMVVGTETRRRGSTRNYQYDRRSSGERVWLAFWREFGCFIQDWYSRIKIVNPRELICAHQTATAFDPPEARSGFTTWQMIDPDPPAEAYSPVREIFESWMTLKSYRGAGTYRRAPDNLVCPGSFLARNPNYFKNGWTGISESDRSDSNFYFDGYCRRYRELPRHLSRSVRKSIRRSLIRKLRRGPGGKFKGQRIKNVRIGFVSKLKYRRMGNCVLRNVKDISFRSAVAKRYRR